MARNPAIIILDAKIRTDDSTSSSMAMRYLAFTDWFLKLVSVSATFSTDLLYASIGRRRSTYAQSSGKVSL